MSRRFAAFAALLLAAAATLPAQTARSPAPSPGSRIPAHDGDTIVVENDARVKIVRRREANVRAIFEPNERWFVLLVDYVTATGGPDGRVDTTYNYTGLSGDWPIEPRYEGPAIVEDYSVAGEGGPSGIGIAVRAGLVQLVGMGQAQFRDPAAVAVLSFKGAGRAGAGNAGFDDVERRMVDQARRNTARQAQLPSGISTSVSMTATGPVSGAEPPRPAAPVRVGGDVRAPVKLVDVRPVVPDAAVRAGVKGVVILELTIDQDGAVQEARVLRSVPMLDQAAVDAARQWRFEPTQLNGQPVPVIMTATVSFN